MNSYRYIESGTSGFMSLFFIMFFLVVGLIVLQMIRGAMQWNKNNNSPVLTVHTRIVAKRINVTEHQHADADNISMNHTTSSTTYYVTFQVDSGDRMEFLVPSGEYGLMVEGDNGNLTFQGTRFKGFERI